MSRRGIAIQKTDSPAVGTFGGRATTAPMPTGGAVLQTTLADFSFVCDRGRGTAVRDGAPTATYAARVRVVETTLFCLRYSVNGYSALLDLATSCPVARGRCPE